MTSQILMFQVDIWFNHKSVIIVILIDCYFGISGDDVKPTLYNDQYYSTEFDLFCKYKEEMNREFSN